MSIFNPLDLLFFNFLFPVVIIFSKNIYIDMICFSFGVIILILHKRYLRLVKFLIVYLIFQLLYYGRARYPRNGLLLNTSALTEGIPERPLLTRRLPRSRKVVGDGLFAADAHRTR